MRPSLSFLLLLVGSVMAQEKVQLEYDQTYQLRVYAPALPQFNGTLIAWDETQSSYLAQTPAPKNTSPSSSAARRPRSARPSLHELPRRPHPQRGPSSTKGVQNYLAIMGPTARSEYRIVSLEYPAPANVGVSFEFNKWNVVPDSDGRQLLRPQDVAGKSASETPFWALAEESWGWVLWWYLPTALNKNDLGKYHRVDIEVAPVLSAGSTSPAGPISRVRRRIQHAQR
ncbi:unnamed protein product [Parascedosporium putredinis]|uniref:DUF3108 domain-containing protein n=1 Tax=Parascedosporium putredinis TaxID=1442378 RepID=A0A9P1M884_9PEZI|nr:unnamed protein product [Parascedosporium putredinis]CAI7992155.1 unnamed protein product [Parascedosporium putredinis]